MYSKEAIYCHCCCTFIVALGGQAQAYTPTLGLLLHLLKECITDCQVVMEDSMDGLSGKQVS